MPAIQSPVNASSTVILGRVLTAMGGAAVARASVQVLSSSGSKLGQAITKADGSFRIVVQAGALAKLDFRVVIDGADAPVKAVTRRGVQGATEVELRVERALIRPDLARLATIEPADLTNFRFVTGRLFRPGGELYVVDDSTVRAELHVVKPGASFKGSNAFAKTEICQRAQSDAAHGAIADGKFVIGYDRTYAGDQLVVIVFENSEEIGRSAVIRRAGANHAVDVVLAVEPSAPKSRYDEIAAALDELGLERTNGNGESWAEGVTRKHMAVLRGMTEFTIADLKNFLAAAVIAAKTDLPDMPVFGMLQVGAPTALKPFLKLPPDAVQAQVEQAVAGRHIPASFGVALEDFVEQHHAARRTQTLQSNAPDSLSRLVAPLLPTGALVATFLQLFEQHPRSPSAFWSAVQSHGQLGEYASSLRQAVDLGLACMNWCPFIEALRASELPDKSINGLVDATDVELTALIPVEAGGGPILPDGIVGEDGEERQANFIRMIRFQLDRMRPNRVLRRAILNGDHGWQPEGLASFLSSDPDFNFLNFSSGSVSELTAEARNELYAYRRMLRLVEGPDLARKIQQLRQNQLTSATRIAARSPQALASQLGWFWPPPTPFTSAAEIAALHARASQTFRMVAALLARHAPAAAKPAVATVPTRTPGMAPLPTVKDALDGIAACDCAEWKSALSPGAYYVDLMGWAKARGMWFGWTRAELENLIIDEASTYVAIPTIDVINEILEFRVAGLAAFEQQQPAPTLLHVRTTLSAEEARVTPEHRYDAAYDALASACAPGLPFARPLAEARAFAAHLGVRLSRCMSDWGLPDAPSTHIAIERLGTNARTWQLIANGSPEAANASMAARWGRVTFDAWNARQLAGIGSGPYFLATTGLTFDQVLDLMHTRAGNPQDGGTGVDWDRRRLRLVHDSWGDPCDPSSWRFIGRTDDPQTPVLPETNDFVRFDRFLRLWRTTGWSMLQLDKALHALGLSLNVTEEVANDGLDLSPIADLAELLDRTRLPIEELLAWNAPLDTFPDRSTTRAPQRSLYQRVFLRRDVIGAPANSLYRLADDQAELHSTTADLVEQRATLAQLLGADLASIDLWLVELQGVGGLANPTKLHLATLSALYRRASLARQLGLDASGLARLRAACSADPFASPAAALAFLDEAEAVGACGHTVDELHHLLRHDASAPHRAPSDSEIVTALVAVRQAGGDALGEEARVEAVKLAVADALGLSPAAVGALMSVDLAGENTSVQAVLAHDAFLYPSPEPEAPHEDMRRAGAQNQLAAFLLWERLVKLKALIDAWALSPAELASWVASSHSDVLSPSCVSREAATPDATFRTDVARLIQTGRLLRAGRSLPGLGDAADVLSAFGAATSNASGVQATLVSRTGWKSGEVADAVERFADEGAIGLSGTLSALKLLSEAHRLRAEVGTLVSWVDDPISATTSEGIVALARTRHRDLASWSAVAGPIRDQLRVAQRDALLAWLRSRSSMMYPMSSEADLIRSFLTDVHVAPCARTSRVQHATLSLQLAVEQAMFTAGVAWFSEEDRRSWAWTKSYRVWEAARKVFLWPENWLDPSVRRDATPLFEAFTNKLTADPIDDDRIEGLYDEYLDGLGELANLVPVAILQADGDPTTLDDDVLHVLARTPGIPAKHYYRWREAGTRWQPWQAVPASIESDHVVLAVHNRRLFCFWALLKEETEESAGEGRSPKRTMNISVYWMTQQRGRWSGVQVLTAIRPLSGADVPDAPSCVRIAAQHTTNGALEVALYGVYQTVEPDPSTQDAAMVAPFVGVSQFAAMHGLPAPDTGGAAPAGATARHRTFRKLRMMRFDEGSQSLASAGIVQVPTLHGQSPFGSTLLAPENATVDGQPFRLSPGRVRIPIPGDPSGDTQATVFAASGSLLYLLPSSDTSSLTTSSPCAVYSHRRSYLIEPRSLGQAEPSDAENQGAVDLLAVPLEVASWFMIPSLLPSGEEDDEVLEADDVVDGSASEGMVQAGLAAGAVAAAGHTGDAVATSPTTPEFLVTALHHPYAERFRAAVARQGVFGLLKPEGTGPDSGLLVQALSDDGATYTALQPSTLIVNEALTEEIDFAPASPTGVYNWELFVHMPWRTADQLAQEGRFEQALLWLESIFDPTQRAMESPSVWRVKPLTANLQALDAEWGNLAWSTESREAREKLARLEQQIVRWREDPFDPHRIATLRPVAYQRAVVMKYLDILIAWADERFRRDTAESINEATQLYVRASAILGPRPQSAACGSGSVGKSYWEITNGLPAGADLLAEQIENNLFRMRAKAPGKSKAPTPHVSGASFFGIPSNPKLEGYWDTLADRLFKIRHCQNFEGQMRALPLFEPPIDPALLVRATAVGLDVSTALAGQAPGLPNYRFSYMLARAQALAGSVQRLGGALLSALEKRDAEALALLRGRHEIDLLSEVRESRARAVEEAAEALAVARSGLRAAQASLQHYEQLLDQDLLPSELVQQAASKLAEVESIRAQGFSTQAGFLRNFPQILASVPPATEFGGTQLAGPVEALASVHSLHASIARGVSAVAGVHASNQRRRQEWSFARDQAEHQVTSAERQALGAQIRLAIAQHELRTHERQVAQSREIHDWMLSKYTNGELYAWMAGQLSTLHRQTWQLALDTARQAEACFRHEHAKTAAEASFIRLDAWDTGRKGLLAGERLQSDLERMEMAYLKEDRREFEMTKHVSLRDLDPYALLTLRETGTCAFALPESHFDLDHPGHYFRRLQAVSVTIPLVAGAFGRVNATLTLTASEVRVSSVAGVTVPVDENDPPLYPKVSTTDTRFLAINSGKLSIALSDAQQDSGLFQLDYRDPKYLPFERCGAVSGWTLTLDDALAQFDHRSIADVVLHLRYTARDGVNKLAVTGSSNAARLRTALDAPTRSDGQSGLRAYFSAKSDLPDAWWAFKNPAENEDAVLTVPFGDANLIPGFASLAKLTRVQVFRVGGGSLSGVDIAVGAGAPEARTFESDATGLPLAELAFVSPGVTPAPVTISTGAAVESLDDLLIVIHYSVAP